VGGGTGFAPEVDLPGVAAAAGGAYAATVSEAGQLPVALSLALAEVRRGRSAVISVHVPSAAPPPAGPHHPAPVDPGQKGESP
jgi:hypothetical protein